MNTPLIKEINDAKIISFFRNINNKEEFSNWLKFFALKKYEIEKEELKFVFNFIFDLKDNVGYNFLNTDNKEIFSIVKETLFLCKDIIENKQKILVFPTNNNFVIKYMGGVNGFSPKKNFVWLFLNTSAREWKENLRETLCHELAHSLSPYYKGSDFNLGEGIILDGIAEHFKDDLLKNKKSPWVNTINRNEAKKILKEIKPKLYIKDKDLYEEIFFGKGKYPNWVGYSIGYYLIEEYLKHHKKDWNNIIKKSPEEILKESLSTFIHKI